MSTYTVDDFDNHLANGPYAWPGGYPLFFVMSDGEVLGFQAAIDNAEEIREAILNDSNNGWRITTCCINWEDDFLVCCHDGDPIPSAYGEGGDE